MALPQDGVAGPSATELGTSARTDDGARAAVEIGSTGDPGPAAGGPAHEGGTRAAADAPAIDGARGQREAKEGGLDLPAVRSGGATSVSTLEVPVETESGSVEDLAEDGAAENEHNGAQGNGAQHNGVTDSGAAAPVSDAAAGDTDAAQDTSEPASDQEPDHGPRTSSNGAAQSVPSSVDMAPPRPEPAPGVPRDEVWGQDGADTRSAAVLSQLIESVTMPAAEEPDSAGEDASTSSAPLLPGDGTGAGLPGDEPGGSAAEDRAEADEVEPEAGPAAELSGGASAQLAQEHDPDLMDELPTDRPVPADAIKRASEALDAAVNAAPAVIGHAVVDDDEEVAYVDAEFTHSDRETASEAEPDAVASDYSGGVTDPIPVQSLSAPGVSRETSGAAETAHGTQQPTGGPHGSDDERRSALIATVPAVDDTTPVAAELAMDARRRIELQGRRFPRPPKTRIITVANQKGGVGKTTTTVNIAAGLAQSGLNVLVIDNDPQGNASTALGIEHRAGTPSVYEILVEGESLASTVQECPDIPNLWGVPATIDLSGSEIELVSLVSRETRLRKAIDKYLADRLAAGEERIDYVLIDCPPSLGLLTVNAFVAGREVFIPIQCEYYALEGLSQLLKTIDLIRSHLNPELRVSSILLTMYDGRTNLAQQVAGEVRSHFPAETFKTTIPRSVRISEAPSYGQTVMTYDATSTGALAYLQASRELAERGQGGSSPRRAMKPEAVGAQD